MDNNSSSKKIISRFVDGVFKTHKELETIPIPELYDLPFDIFLNNPFYNSYGFLGISGVQIITPKQTILNGYPLVKRVLHSYLYSDICSKIYDGEKLEQIRKKIFNTSSFNVNSLNNNINHISLRYLNTVKENDGEMDANNFCVIYGNLNNINSYQKQILLESVISIGDKDSRIPIYHYDSQKEITIDDIISIIPHDDIVLDDDEKLLSTDETGYVHDISNYRCKDSFDCFYIYDDNIKCIKPVAKFNIPNPEMLTEYGVKVLDAKTLNKMIVINKSTILPLMIYADPQSLYPTLYENQVHSK